MLMVMTAGGDEEERCLFFNYFFLLEFQQEKKPGLMVTFDVLIRCWDADFFVELSYRELVPGGFLGLRA